MEALIVQRTENGAWIAIEVPAAAVSRWKRPGQGGSVAFGPSSVEAHCTLLEDVASRDANQGTSSH